MARGHPAWERLVAEGWFASRDEAERWILSGKVHAANRPVTSAGQRVAREDALTVRGRELRYVAKGGLKLEGALAAFGVSARGRVCIDAGASTGGFTDCLVQHGAARVYAVDAGYGQLAGSLRNHPAVVNLERTNLGDETLRGLDPPPTLGTADLSYLSLRKAAPLFAAIMRNQGDLICLVKPLFEIDDALARRTGVIDSSAYEPLLLGLADGFAAQGYALLGATHSPVTGNSATLEFFLWLGLDGRGGLLPADKESAIADAVRGALALPAYSKR